MSKYWNDEGYYSQPTEAELQRKMAATREKARKKGTALEPVVIHGRTIAKSWWGAAWCTNLERYADYGSRLDRGRRYVRTGCVVDLKIQKGKILAKVQGTRRTPYKVEIRISPLSEEKCQSIIERCGRKLSTLEELTAGRFPEEMGELFQGRDGLFPTPREISFTCSCPDWALMCKHVAAVLYGVGARLDDDPSLFFELRGIDMGRFIDVTLADRVERMLSNARQPSSRILDGEDLTALFGVL
ncbi:MAG: SWIM zinc finger family protein [Oscillibacter sp.]|nr:SWIM zinc finger family protein [Oscillibacter sp.]